MSLNFIYLLVLILVTGFVWLICFGFNLCIYVKWEEKEKREFSQNANIMSQQKNKNTFSQIGIHLASKIFSFKIFMWWSHINLS